MWHRFNEREIENVQENRMHCTHEPRKVLHSEHKVFRERCEICYIWICRTCRAGEGAKSVKGDKTTTGRWKNRGTVYDASMREMVPVSRGSRLPESRLECEVEGGEG